MTRPVALVTGARRGIGRAICVALAKSGNDIAFTDVAEDEATEETLKLFADTRCTCRLPRRRWPRSPN
jgi:NAD(P)-dependent dehydrogenase (short-subunit alcohol dehydrogenase family)